MEELIHANEGLIRAIVHEYAPRGWSQEDVLQEARVAAMRAADDYRPGGPASVATWIAWKIRGVCSGSNRYRYSIGKGRATVASLDGMGSRDGQTYAVEPSTGRSAEDDALDAELLDHLTMLAAALPTAHAEAVGVVGEYVRVNANTTGARWLSLLRRRPMWCGEVRSQSWVELIRRSTETFGIG